MKALIKEIKENNQDFEFYPTTDEILESLKNRINLLSNKSSILDIGAGNGKVLNTFDIRTKYAIEKSKILIENMNKDIFIVGTDFNEQTLIDKKVDIIFCNPPYSVYEEWSNKIIKEANSYTIFFVIPERWKKQKSILDSLKLRDAEYEIINSFDFLDSEDRKARTKVDLIQINLNHKGYYSEIKEDPFNIWFNENFKFKKDEKNLFDNGDSYKKQEKLKEVVSKENLIVELVYLYNEELANIINNYRTLETLDFSIFKELNIDINNVKESLKLRIEGLKNLYWKELFDNLDKIIDRLTYSSRDNLLRTLMDNTGIDFTVSNVYSVVIWTIKNANEYYNKQLLEMYISLSDKDNIKNYKSNKRMIEDGWRYNKKDMSHYSLDYRIVHNFYNALDIHYWNKTVTGLSLNAKRFIQDIFTISNNLGFEITTKLDNIHWEAGKPNNFYLKDNSLFVEIKAFKNGNLHFKFKKEFMKKFNLEAGRLNGWIKSPKQASEEFDITEEEAKKIFSINFKMLPKNILMIENIKNI